MNMKEKNILLTTLGSTGNNRYDYQYFYYDHNGQLSYCNSLSIAEAGTKYILSRENIDEVIVLGSGATYNAEDALKPLQLRTFADYRAEGIENLSEYSFFRYRIAQFMEDIDVEGADVIESVGPDRQKEIIEAFRSVCDQAEHIPDLGFIPKKAFHLLNQTPELQLLMKKQLDGLSGQERQWLMQYIFIKLDPASKFHILEYNEKLQMCFVPITRAKDSVLPLDNILEIVQAVNSGNPDHINLYMDMQGIGSADGFTLISVFSMIANDDARRISIRGLITTHSNPSQFANPIDDKEMKRYDINLLVSGMNSFVKYGKVDLIRDYWYSRQIDQPQIELLIYGMQNVADGISLCDLANLEYGIRILKKVFSNPDTESMPELESNIFRLISRTIRMDYGNLITEEKISGIELIKWAYRKNFYQQTLTIIESKIPLEIVQKGILYYAKDEETRLHMLESLQVCYENTHPIQRWGFKDTDHYFIKFYGRQRLNRGPFNRDKFKAYAELRIRELSEDEEEFVQAYSVLEDRKPLLLKMLTAYYRIGEVRNAVNHAEEKAPIVALENIDVHAGNENLSMLQKAIEDFISIYDEVLHELERLPQASPVLISGEEFKNWSMEHSYRGRGSRYGGGRKNDYGRGRGNDGRNGFGSRNDSGGRNDDGGRDGNDGRNGSGGRDWYGGRNRRWSGYRDRNRKQDRDAEKYEVRTENGNIYVYIGSNCVQGTIPENPEGGTPGQIIVRHAGDEDCRIERSSDQNQGHVL